MKMSARSLVSLVFTIYSLNASAINICVDKVLETASLAKINEAFPDHQVNSVLIKQRDIKGKFAAMAFTQEEAALKRSLELDPNYLKSLRAYELSKGGADVSARMIGLKASIDSKESLRKAAEKRLVDQRQFPPAECNYMVFKGAPANILLPTERELAATRGLSKATVLGRLDGEPVTILGDGNNSITQKLTEMFREISAGSAVQTKEPGRK